MNKSRDIYYLILALITAAAALTVFMPWLLPAVILLGAWWVLFYNRLSYNVTDKEIIIKSGVLFRKLRCVPLQNIQWVMRLKLPFRKTASLSALHTASGMVVIFADFSTKS